MQMAGRTFASGRRAGERCCWRLHWPGDPVADRIAEVEVEKEIANIVHAAAEGDFSRSVINMDGKDGFFGQMAEGMNGLMETSRPAWMKSCACWGRWPRAT